MIRAMVATRRSANEVRISFGEGRNEFSEAAAAKEEAAGFLAANTHRRPLTSVEKFKAMVKTEDPHAMVAMALLEKAGRTASASSTPTTVRCIATLTALVRTDRDTLERVWPLVCELCVGHPLHERILWALPYIEARMDGDSLTKARWRNRLLALGHDELLSAMAKAASFYARGGSKVWAIGIVQALNHGLRNKLQLRDMPDV